MACNFNCTQLFSLHLKGSIVTSNVLTLIHKQINNEMFFNSPTPTPRYMKGTRRAVQYSHREKKKKKKKKSSHLHLCHFLFSCSDMSSVCLH